MLIIDKLQQTKTMSDHERTIAGFMLAQGKKLVDASTRNIADATFTSPATVVRLCKKLGFSGFDDMKKQYMKEMEYLDRQFGTIDPNFPFDAKDTQIKAANKMAELFMDTVKDTLSLLDYEQLKKAIFIIQNHLNLHLFSYGTTLNLAESFREKMLKINKKVYVSTNLNYQLYEANTLTKDDAAILISYSGETEKILMTAQTLKKRHVPMIVITSLGENSLSKLADCCLVISTKESLFHNLGDFSTHISVHYLLDVIYSSFFLCDFDNNYETKMKNVSVYEAYRKSDNPILNDMDD